MIDLEVLWVLVPLAGIALAAYNNHLKHAERMALIAKEICPEGEPTSPQAPTGYAGFVTAGVGGGLTIAALVSLFWINELGVAILTMIAGVGGLTCAGAGLGILAYHRVGKPR